MAGNQVPVVMIPRYTCYSSGSGSSPESFMTIGMDVSQYAAAYLSVWRNTMITGTTFLVIFEESSDQNNWTAVTYIAPSSTPLNNEPTAGTEKLWAMQLTKRWFRVKITLTSGTSSIQTCWCVGFLEERET